VLGLKAEAFGYSETRLGEHVARVEFHGQGMSLNQTADFCTLRCAELTLESGCQYFTVLESDDTIHFLLDTTTSTRLIRCSEMPPSPRGEFLHARDISSSMRSKYALPAP